jgi:hypothetical protein
MVVSRDGWHSAWRQTAAGIPHGVSGGWHSARRQRRRLAFRVA